MAGKNQLLRIGVLDRCFRSNSRIYDLGRLSDECLDAGIDSVSKRTIQSDIKAMRDGIGSFPEAPIICDKEYDPPVYYYSEPNFNIHSSQISNEEFLTLLNVFELANQFPEFEQTEKFKEILQKLKETLSIPEQWVKTGVIQFEKVEYPSAAQWIRNLYPYVRENNPLKVYYRPFGGEFSDIHEIIPELLKEYNGRWYLLGWNPKEKRIDNLALDRIERFEEWIIDHCQFKYEFDPIGYFKNVIGITISIEGPQRIVFETSDFLKNYIKTKPFHSSQKEIKGEANQFEMTVHINPEVISKILAWGEDIEIIEPAVVRDKLKKKIQKMMELYSKE